MAAMSPEEIKTVMETASPDLKFLLDREGIMLITQARIMQAGITTMRQFGAFFTDTDDLRKVAKDSLGLDPDTLAQRVELSKLVVAWESAKVRSTRLAEAEADAEIRQEAKQLKGTDVNSIRKAYEAKWWKLEEEQVPAKSYLERISEGVERGELRAELLSEAVNKIEGETDVMKAVWDPTGTIKAVRTTPSVPLPRDPEELRTRVALLGRAWAFVALMQPNSAPLQGMTPQDWASYLDHLLGPYVHRLHARDEFGNISSSPPWSLVLSYEQEVRRKMLRLVTEDNQSMKDALKAACNDSVVKERYFTTPLAVSGPSRKRKLENTGDTYPTNTRNDHGGGGKSSNGKGKGKGRGKSKGKQSSAGFGKNGCARSTPDGKPICFAFNDKPNPCTKSKCPFLHVCGKCFKDHPMYQCGN